MSVLVAVAAAYFEAVYRGLAEHGNCDLPGGAESDRVLQEWLNEGCPNEVVAISRERANRVPSARAD